MKQAFAQRRSAEAVKLEAHKAAAKKRAQAKRVDEARKTQERQAAATRDTVMEKISLARVDKQALSPHSPK